jgi:2-dehydropantoate 2-reductase
MRFVVYGAGAVGGVLGARLHEHDHEVVLIARGAHYEAIRSWGLQVDSPDASVTLPIPVVDAPEHVDFRPDDVVMLCMKSQDTESALVALGSVAPPDIPVVCVQNGVANERAALRRFERVYGVCVMCPAVHLQPGVVAAYAAPTTGLFDIGRYPRGSDNLAERVADACNTSACESIPRDDIMRWKYRKLLNNLSNAIDALCGPDAHAGDLGTAARDEGVECLTAAGIAFVSEEEDRERRGTRLQFDSAAARSRPGASMWQSMARGVSVEADYLNGEIVLLGRLHGVPTPVNAALQQLVNARARDGAAPGALSPDDIIRIVSAPKN